MDKREEVARRVAANCAEIQVAAANGGLKILAHLLGMAALYAKRYCESPAIARVDEDR